METNQNICPLFLSGIQKRDVSCKIAFFPLSDAVEAKHSSKLPASRWKNLKVKQMRQDVYKIEVYRILNLLYLDKTQLKIFLNSNLKQ